MNYDAKGRVFSNTLDSYLLTTDGLDRGFDWMDKTQKWGPGCADLAAGVLARLFEHLQRGQFDILHHFLHQLGHKKGDDMGLVMFAPKFDARFPRNWATLGIEQNELFSGAYIAGLGPSFACTTVIEDYSSNLSISALVRMNQVDSAGLRARVEVHRIFQKVFSGWIRGERDPEQSRALIQELLCQYEQDPAVAQVGIVIAYHQGFTLLGRYGDVAVYTQSGDSTIPLPADDRQGGITVSVFDQGVERLVLADSQDRALAAGELVQAGLRNERIPVESLELKKWHGLNALQALEPVVGDGAILIYSNQWMFRSGPSPLCDIFANSSGGLGILLTGRPKINDAYIERVYGPLPSKQLASAAEPAVSAASGEVAATVTNGTAVAVPTGSTVAADSTSVPQTPNDGMQQSKANVAALDPEAVRKLSRQNPKVTFSPEWKQEYDETRRPLPPDPNWIEIEGFGRVTREQALAGKFTERGFIVELADAQVVRLRWFPKGWQNTIGLS